MSSRCSRFPRKKGLIICTFLYLVVVDDDDDDDDDVDVDVVFGYVGCLEVSSIIEAAGFVSK